MENPNLQSNIAKSVTKTSKQLENNILEVGDVFGIVLAHLGDNFRTNSTSTKLTYSGSYVQSFFPKQLGCKGSS